jgi:hypothetical protein
LFSLGRQAALSSFFPLDRLSFFGSTIFFAREVFFFFTDPRAPPVPGHPVHELYRSSLPQVDQLLALRSPPEDAVRNCWSVALVPGHRGLGRLSN